MTLRAFDSTLVPSRRRQSAAPPRILDAPDVARGGSAASLHSGLRPSLRFAAAWGRARRNGLPVRASSVIIRNFKSGLPEEPQERPSFGLSAGADPGDRRLAWRVITDLRAPVSLRR